MKLKDLLIGAGGILAIVAVLLPWYTVSAFGLKVSGNGFEEPVTAFGVLSLILGIGLVVWKALLMFGALKLKLSENVYKIIDTCVGGLMALFGIISIINVQNQSMNMASTGFGVIMLVIIGIAIAVMAWVKIDKTIGKAPKLAKK